MRYNYFCIALLAILSSCAPKKVQLSSEREIIRTTDFVYMKDEKGRLYVMTNTQKGFDDAMKKLKPGPASVDRMDVWVVTPLKSAPGQSSRH